MFGHRRALLLPVALAGCSPAALLNATVPSEGYRLERDIAYGPGPRHRLDLYQPTSPRADSATVLFFYGGSWRGGSKEQYLFVGQSLAARGVTVAVADYRLHPEVRFPAFVEDGALATRWVTARFGAGSTFLMGHSAGAHIALMLVTNTPYLAAAGVDRTALAGVIGLAGPYDFLPSSSRSVAAVFAATPPEQSQPIGFVRAPLPRALLAHGLADTVVAPRNSERLAAAWQAAGGEVSLGLYPEADHIDLVSAFSDLLRGRAPVLADTLRFLDRTP